MPDAAVALSIIAVCVLGVSALLALAAIVSLAFAEDAHLPRAGRRRARQLFYAQLDARQRRSWRFRRRFDVLGSAGHRYTIGSYRPFNVHARGAVFCVQVEGEVPLFDKLLAQKLLLESDERRFLAYANVRTYSRTWHERVAAAREALA